MNQEGRERLAKLFGRLGSDQAGERENALAAIERALVAAGLSWSWVCELVASGILTADQDAAARDRLLTRLVTERLGEAKFGAYSLLPQEQAEMLKVNNEVIELGSVRSISSEAILRALDLADLVRRRVGRRW